ncbi:MAG TPA: tetratricopeptide repeat protein [Thermoanaerobaculia bacterium]|nr:tetratricopeptide repeat protein [Thermoanaerobaculia bacterium]
MAVQRDKVIASAEKLVAKGKIEPAIKEYERLLDDNPNDVNTLNRIGDLWVRISRTDEAVKVFVKIADHYSRDGFFLKAIAIFKKINKLDPSKLDIYAKLADLYAKQGLAMEAKSQYQVLADYYLKHGDPANALATYRKISELDPNSINVHVKLADLYSQNNQTANALKEYDRIGRMLLKRGMLDEAVQVFRKALKIDGSNLDLAESLFNALHDAKDFKNASQLIETSLESNPGNPRLLSLLGRAQLGLGNVAGAKQSLEQGLAANPSDTAIREALTDVYLRLNSPDQALQTITPVVEAEVNKGEGKAGVENLNRVLRVDAGHIPTLEKLVAVYTKLREETNILSSMNSLAEAHIGRKQLVPAAAVLRDLIKREPQNAQHKEKLAFVQNQLGGHDEAPSTSARKSEVTAQPDTSITIDDSEGQMDFSIDLDSSEAVDLDLSPPIENDRTAALDDSVIELSPVEEVVSADEDDDLDLITEHLTEAEVFAKYGLADKAIEHLRTILTRAPRNLQAHEKLLRVFLDEGMLDEARTIGAAYLGLLKENGDLDTIQSVQAEMLRRGVSSVTTAAPAPVEAPKRAPAPAPVAVAAPPAIEPAVEQLNEIELGSLADEDEIVLDLDDMPDTELSDLSEEFTVEPSMIAISDESELTLNAPDQEIPVSLTESSIELDFVPEEVPPVALPSIDDGPAHSISLDPTLQLPDDEPAVAADALDSIAFEMPAEIELDSEPPAAALEASEPVQAEQIDGLDFSGSLSADSIESAIDTPSIEKSAELSESTDFTTPFPSTESSAMEGQFDMEQPVDALPGGLTDDSSEPLVSGALLDLVEDESLVVPVTAPVEELGEIDYHLEGGDLEDAGVKLSRLSARFPSDPEIVSRQERLDLLVAEKEKLATAQILATPTEDATALFDDFEDLVEPPAAAPVVGVPESPAPGGGEESLFADEDDFFDLAAELEEELSQDGDELLSLSEEEQSLEEIFKEFKKGVEQQLDSEDYDTHYNLGIAYKEMGLTDEAIGEFQLASKDPKRIVECCSMLGLCFLEKGMPQLSIKWYRKGLESPDVTEEETVGLLYDLGSAQMEVGDATEAQKTFTEVYGLNSNYRDIASRIKELEDVNR